jgi:hypothetical protein
MKIFYYLFITIICFTNCNSHLENNKINELTFLGFGNSPCETPVECYLNAIEEINKLKTNINTMIDSACNANIKSELEKRNYVTKSELNDSLNKSLSLKKNWSISLNSDYINISALKIQEESIIIEHKFILEVPSIIDATATGHIGSDNYEYRVALYADIRFDSQINSDLYLFNGKSLNSIEIKKNVELEPGTHSVKFIIILRDYTTGRNNMKPRLNLNIFP